MMDAHFWYNRILMAKTDEEKTSFITDWGTYCYKVMSFGLRNADATFHNLVDRVFEKQVGRNMLTYINDILVKSNTLADHPRDLKEHAPME